jgi:hypothetical protein
MNPWAVLSPAFMGDRWCVECSSPPELYCFRSGYVSICSRCTVRILGACEARLPFELIVLESEAQRSIAQRDAADAEPPGVEFDAFFRCALCDRLGESKDARYPTGPGGSGRAHCRACYVRVMERVARTESGSPAGNVAVRAKAEPAPQVRHVAPIPEVVRFRLIAGRCATCGNNGDVFAFGYWMIMACPECLARLLGGHASRLNGEFCWLQLLREAHKEIRFRTGTGRRSRRAEAHETTCQCGASSIRMTDAAHRFMWEQYRGRPPHCIACSGLVPTEGRGAQPGSPGSTPDRRRDR